MDEENEFVRLFNERLAHHLAAGETEERARELAAEAMRLAVLSDIRAIADAASRDAGGQGTETLQ